MFITLVVFIVSLIVELLIIFLLNPINHSGLLNNVHVFIFALNTSVLLGSLFAVLQVVAYWYLHLYEDIITKVYVKRAFVFGIFSFVLIMLKIYGILDIQVFAALFVVFSLFELLVSRNYWK
jgi:hypothetical protein